MKPAAQLTSNLLARKGDALPVGIFPQTTARLNSDTSNGWGSVPTDQQAKKNAAAALPRSSKKSPIDKTPSHEDHSDRVAMTLRLDPRQHRRLRLISVHSHMSAREIMTAALDLYLDHLEAELDIPPCECLNSAK